MLLNFSGGQNKQNSTLALIEKGFKGNRICCSLTGATYVSGFGVHHPGGLFLSQEEREGLAHKDREIVVSY